MEEVTDALEYLFLFLCFLPIPLSGYDPNFDIHFHKSPSWVFGRHPFQGVCTGSPGINGTLALEISNLYYGTRNIIASYVLPRDYLPMREKKQPAVRIAVEPGITIRRYPLVLNCDKLSLLLY